MNNSNTSEQKKSSIADRLRVVAEIVEELEESGIHVISTTAGDRMIGDYILFSGTLSKFRKWAKRRSLEVSIFLSNRNSELGLNWIIKTIYHGVEVRSFMIDQEKEAYEREAK